MKKVVIIAIFLFVSLMYFGLGRDYLFDWDEGIYGTIGREMVTTGNLLTPTWNGNLWLEKPPMIGWVCALGITLAGDNELGVRLFMPLFAGLTLYAIFRIGQKLGGTLMGSTSAALLGYFNLFLSRARASNTDGMLLAAIAWTLWLLLSGAPAWLVGIVMGLAIMVKGPAGLLAILIAIPLLIKKPKKFLLQAIGYMLLAVLPWHLYALVAHGWSFITPYLMEQVIRRATVPIEFHTESRWFYLNFLTHDLGLGVGIVSLLGYATMFKNWLSKKSLDKNFLLAWWLAIPLIIFTLAKTRLAWYILPVYPAIALSCGYLITAFAKDKKSKTLISILVVGMLAQMLYHAFSYIDFGKNPTPYSDSIQVASELSRYHGSTIAMLVSESERIAQAILPRNQTISSSFRYGGAPSIVWYSHKHVQYYYDYDVFKADLLDNPSIDSVIVTIADQDKVPPSFTQVSQSGNYLGYVREDNYALR